MKLLVASFLVLAGVLGFTHFSDAASRVNGYYRSNGTYVQPYYRTEPNSYRFDNYSSKGVYNPYTGRYGTRSYWGY